VLVGALSRKAVKVSARTPYGVASVEHRELQVIVTGVARPERRRVQQQAGQSSQPDDYPEGTTPGHDEAEGTRLASVAERVTLGTRNLCAIDAPHAVNLRRRAVFFAVR
jgi:hypothetical protein